MRLDEPYAPDPTQLRRFKTDGHITLRGLLTGSDLTTLEPDLSACVDARNEIATLAWSDRTTYERAFIQVGNLFVDNDAARSLVFSTRLASAAAALLGVDGVRLYHDQALYKEPTVGDGGHTPWHVDQYYWPLATDRSITAWIPLVDVPAEMGPLALASGSHGFEDGRALAISDDSEAFCDRALADGGYTRSEAPFALGDVSFHLGWTYHCARANRSPHVRKVMTIIYIDADMHIAEPTNDHQRADLAKWFPGAAPGERAATELNPLLWSSAPRSPQRSAT